MFDGFTNGGLGNADAQIVGDCLVPGIKVITGERVVYGVRVLGGKLTLSEIILS